MTASDLSIKTLLPLHVIALIKATDHGAEKISSNMLRTARSKTHICIRHKCVCLAQNNRKDQMYLTIILKKYMMIIWRCNCFSSAINMKWLISKHFSKALHVHIIKQVEMARVWCSEKQSIFLWIRLEWLYQCVVWKQTDSVSNAHMIEKRCYPAKPCADQ